MPVERLRIRPGQEQDLAQLHQILREAPEAAVWSDTSLREFFNAYQPYFLVASQRTEIQGFICGRPLADEAEILNLAIRPGRRRRGIGKRLVHAFLKMMAQRSATLVHLEVRESNAAAIALYALAGFQVTGKRPGYYREPDEPAVLMTRSVNPIAPENESTV